MAKWKNVHLSVIQFVSKKQQERHLSGPKTRRSSNKVQLDLVAMSSNEISGKLWERIQFSVCGFLLLQWERDGGYYATKFETISCI